jgi:cytochrome c biogenesis protein CcdA
MGKISFLVVLSAALADSVNPCEIGILTMALLYIIFSYGKEKVLGVGLTFSLGVAVSYYIYGVFIAHVFRFIPWIRIIVGVAAILLAAPRLVSALRNEELKLTPPALRPVVSNFLRMGNVGSALVGGLIAGFILMPCSSGPYYVILTMLSHDIVAVRLQAYLWLALYNAIVILPLVVITLGAHFLVDVTVLRDYKDKLVPVMEFGSSLILLALGLYVLTQM